MTTDDVVFWNPFLPFYPLCVLVRLSDRPTVHAIVAQITQILIHYYPCPLPRALRTLASKYKFFVRREERCKPMAPREGPVPPIPTSPISCETFCQANKHPFRLTLSELNHLQFDPRTLSPWHLAVSLSAPSSKPLSVLLSLPKKCSALASHHEPSRSQNQQFIARLAEF
jgi:hypothetical protein